MDVWSVFFGVRQPAGQWRPSIRTPWWLVVGHHQGVYISVVADGRRPPRCVQIVGCYNRWLYDTALEEEDQNPSEPVKCDLHTEFVTKQTFNTFFFGLSRYRLLSRADSGRPMAMGGQNYTQSLTKPVSFTSVSYLFQFLHPWRQHPKIGLCLTR